MYLFGASGHAKVILDILKTTGVVAKGFYDDDPLKKDLCSIPVVGNADNFNAEHIPCIVSIGNNKIRESIVKRIAIEDYATAIHANTTISDSVKIGKGTVVMAGVTINADTILGSHVIVNTAASVDHDCILEDYCHIAPNSTLCGGITIGEGTLVGAGAVIIPSIKIGKWAVVGAGAVVVKDVPDFTTVVGNPARSIEDSDKS